MNIPLIAAALVVGIILGYIASRSGISGSIVSHIAWLEAVIIYAPIDHILAS
jgi:membrane protease YdiL (CAAX protease family)